MRDVIVGTAGHIDHGKTLLVKAMTGTDADRWAEEKRRGITLDIGFATLVEDRGTLHFVDLPGHERFIKNMLAGATGVNVCLLVVAADESVMPQTVEHAQIVRLLGVERGVVALSKTDLVDAETRELALLELSEFLDALGFGRWPVLPVSAVTGEGVPELVDALYAQAEACDPPAQGRPFRLPVDRVFPVKGFGTVVTGTCIGGILTTGGEVEIYPNRGLSRVRGLQVFGKDVPSISQGQRAALNLADLHHQDLGRGCLVAAPGSVWPTHLLDVQVEVLPSARHPLKNAATLALHIHTQEVEAHLHLDGVASLGPGEVGLAQLRMPEPVLAWPGDRFILRLPSPLGTVAGGRVLLVARRKARWRRPVDHETALALGRGDTLGALLVEAGPVGATLEEVGPRLGGSDVDMERRAVEAEASGLLVRWGHGGWWLAPPEAKAWQERAAAWLKARQSGKEPAEWLPRQEFLGRWQRMLGTVRADALLQALATSGKVEIAGDRVRTSGHKIQLTPQQRAAQEAVGAMLATEAFSIRTGKEMEESIGPAVRQILPLMTASGDLARFGGDFFMAASTLAKIRAELASWSRDRGPLISVPEFKDQLGSTRKYVMPLLEYLDDLKWTRREGDGRRILVVIEKVRSEE
jgi:selenocysteine-specific elongation factor